MKIEISREEHEAISKAWDQINDQLEGCSDQQESDRLDQILKGLRSLEKKILNVVQYNPKRP